MAVDVGDKLGVMLGSTPGVEVEDVPTSCVGIRVSVTVGGGLLIASSARAVESPPKTRASEIVAKKRLTPSCRRFCISPPRVCPLYW